MSTVKTLLYWPIDGLVTSSRPLLIFRQWPAAEDQVYLIFGNVIFCKTYHNQNQKNVSMKACFRFIQFLCVFQKTENSLNPFMHYKLNFKNFLKNYFYLAKFSNEAQYTSLNIFRSIFNFYLGIWWRHRYAFISVIFLSPPTNMGKQVNSKKYIS